MEGWSEYRKLVIGSIERLEAAIKELRALIDTLHRDGQASLILVRDELRKELEIERKERTRLEIEFSMQKVRVSLIASGAGAIVGGVIAYFVKHLN
jgi:hypothetical protein